MSKIDKLFDYINFNSNDTFITIETAIEIFEIITNPTFIILYKNDDHIFNSIQFYYNILNMEKNTKTLNDLKNIIQHIFIDNKNSLYFKSQSQIVVASMKIIVHILYQLCYKFSPRQEFLYKQSINTNNDKIQIFINEFKYIVSLV